MSVIKKPVKFTTLTIGLKGTKASAFTPLAMIKVPTNIIGKGKIGVVCNTCGKDDTLAESEWSKQEG